MPRLQFQLRTLLLITLIVGCGLGWWFRPYEIETRWPNGQLRSQASVRRTILGEVVTYGTQSWWWRNGQLARQGESHGCELSRSHPWLSFLVPLENESMYSERGEPVELGGTEFALLWLDLYHETNDSWVMTRADMFPETPHE